LTDEKKKVGKSTKSEPGEKQQDGKDTKNASSSRLQSEQPTKSVQSGHQVFSARSKQSKADTIKEMSTKSSLNSQSVSAATNALSVTARWGLNWQSPNTLSSTAGCGPTLTTDQITESTDTQLSASNTNGDQVSDKKDASKLTVSKNRGKKNNRKNGRVVKLYESLDANVLRDALVNEKDAQTEGDTSQPNRGSDLPDQTAAENDQDLSQACPAVPSLDLQSDFGSRRASLKLVCFSLFSIDLHMQLVKRHRLVSVS